MEKADTNQARLSMVELCRIANISRPTLYKYLQSGVLPPPVKEGPKQFKYDETHIKRLEKIRYLRRHKKLSISEIRQMLEAEAPAKPDSEGSSSDVKNLIFEKTLELFSQKGLTKTRINDITKALNLGKGTFYQYFKSKEDLFLECIERVPEIILPPETWEEIRKERNYFQRSLKRLSFMFDAFPTFVGIISIAKLALRGNDKNSKLKAVECFRTITNALKKDLHRAVQTGVVRDIDQDFIAFITFGIGEAAGYWLMMNPGYSPEECAEKLIDFLSRGLATRNARQEMQSKSGSCHVEVEDLEDTTILLREIRFNGNPCFEGELGSGKLQIDLKRASCIEISEKNQIQTATVTLNNGQIVTVRIDKEIDLSGESSFGKYTVPIAKVRKITSRNSDEME